MPNRTPDGTNSKTSIDTLADEFANKCRGGNCPSITRYAERYPQLADEINEVFPAIAMIEQYRRTEETERADSQRLLKIERRLLDRLGDFRIVREIGRGGMGVVYEAIQESLGRTVALKVLTADVAQAPQQLARFKREAQAAAMLHHTNIVPIFGVGHDDGLYYYVMQHIDGIGLDALVEYQRPKQLPLPRSDSLDQSNRSPTATSTLLDKSLSWRRIATYGIQIAEAVDYAHHQGILHRDIKPANLLVDMHDTVWVTDFGLAKIFGDDGLTKTGDLFGTIRYMAPEQFEGHSTRSSDIYSIGVTLYELATLEPAFGQSDAKQLMLTITQQGVSRSQLTSRSIPKDLETIILKAAAFNSRHRYATAGKLADDLQRFCSGEPISARHTSSLRRVWRWSCRNPALATLSSLSLLLLLLVAIVASIGWIHVEDARQEALVLANQQQRQARALRVANQRARDESEHAHEESERAEDNLQLAMRAFEEIIDRVSNRGFPESLKLDDEDDQALPPILFTDADAELLQSMLAFYEEFALRNNANESIPFEAAKAHHRIGDIRLSLSQFEQALLAYDKALAAYRLIATSGPSDVGVLRVMAEAMNQRGVVYGRTGRLGEAIESHLAARDLLLNQPETITTTATCRFALAQTYNHLGAIWSRPDRHGRPPFHRRPPRGRGGFTRPGTDRQGLLARMQENYEAALRLLEGLLAEDPKNTQYRLALARCHRNCLPLIRHGGNADTVAECLATSVGILERLVADQPDNPRYAFELADVLSIDTPALRETTFGKERQQRMQRAEQIASRLNRVSPNQPEYKTLCANALYQLGLSCHRTGQKDLAVQYLSRSAGHYGELLDHFPSVPAYMASLARVAGDLGTIQREIGQGEASRRTLENTMRRLSAIRTPEADARIARRFTAILQANLNRTLDTTQGHSTAFTRLPSPARHRGNVRRPPMSSVR